jgi:type II secretory pathway pseudopilin PulG
MKNKAGGFSMVDLLVAMFILAILIGASMTFINPGGQFAKARDSERRSDLNQYRIALEAYATANDGLYPVRTTRVDASGGLCADLGTTLMSSCLADPGDNPGVSPNDDYRYRSNNTDPASCGAGDACSSQFVLWSYLETGGVWEVCSDGRQGLLSIDPPALPADADGACQIP